MFEWLKNLFKEKPKSWLGIDLGSSIIKIAEISPGKEKLKLKTYGLASFSTEGFLSNAFSSFVNTAGSEKATVNFEGNDGSAQSEFLPASRSTIKDLSNREIGGIVKELALRAGVETNIAYFAVPSFATFSTIINLPAMPSQEIAAAIPYEAKKYIPVPLEDVVLDWVLIGTDSQASITEALKNNQAGAASDEISPPSIIDNSGGQKKDNDKSEEIKIETGSSENIAGEKDKAADKIGMEKSAGAISQSSDQNIISEDQPAANSFPEQAAEKTNPGAQQRGVQVFLVAILKEIIEKYTQIAQAAGLEIRVLESESICLARALVNGVPGRIMIIDIGDSFIDITLVEDGFVKVIHNAESVIDHFSKSIDKEKLLAEIGKVIKLHGAKAQGGASSMADFSDTGPPVFEGKFVVTGGKISAYNLDYLKEHFKAEIISGSPFSQLEYPQALEPVLKELGPSLAVAIGMAMRQ